MSAKRTASGTRRSRAEALLWHVARHEAGHAVARLAIDEDHDICGPYIDAAWIDPEAIAMMPALKAAGPPYPDVVLGSVDAQARALGFMAETCGDDPQYRQDAWLDAVTTMAGPVAEARSCRMSRLAGFFHFTMGRHGHDLRAVRIRAKLAGRDNHNDDAVAAAWDQAFDLIRPRWAAVEALAKALVDHVHLDGETVEHIVAGAMPDRFPKLFQQLAEIEA